MSGTAAIQDALATDVAGLNALSSALPDMQSEVSNALDIIEGMEGRLIITGLGKSGHIARKLAATYSSTGTPAYYLHPSEASHGDLGMVHPDDAILALSWSGETRELSDVLGYAKRRGVPLIAITSAINSTLAQSADVALVVPTVREACPHNLAPTTSSIVQLALGDALAIALLQRKGFTQESFHGLHPGGSLGAALKRVDEIMHQFSNLPLVSSDTPMIGAISALSEKGFGIVGVTNDEKLCGVITDGDIRRYLGRNADATMKVALHDTLASEIMTTKSVTLPLGMIAGEALSVLRQGRISAAFVTENGRPVGLITMLRLLNRGSV